MRQRWRTEVRRYKVNILARALLFDVGFLFDFGGF
jgi:hypothetical protein